MVTITGRGNEYGNETLEENSACHNQVIERDVVDMIRREVGNIVAAVENRVHDATLSGKYSVAIPRVGMAVRSINVSSGGGPNFAVQNPNQRGFSRNLENPPLMTAYSRSDLNVHQDKNNEPFKNEKFEAADFSAIISIYDQQTHAHQRNDF